MVKFHWGIPRPSCLNVVSSLVVSGSVAPVIYHSTLDKNVWQLAKWKLFWPVTLFKIHEMNVYLFGCPWRLWLKEKLIVIREQEKNFMYKIYYCYENSERKCFGFRGKRVNSSTVNDMVISWWKIRIRISKIVEKKAKKRIEIHKTSRIGSVCIEDWVDLI